MANPQVTSEVRNDLLAVIRAWRETISALQNRDEKTLLPFTDILSYAISLDNAKENTLTEDQQKLKIAFGAMPYGREQVKSRLERSVNSDQHLKATCLSPWGLAKALDRLFFNWMGSGQSNENVSGTSDSTILSHLIGRLFESPYSRKALLHLYNLNLDQPVIELPNLNARILRLSETEVPLVTGEITFTSTLHPSHIGNSFLAFEDNDYENDHTWMSQKWDEAWRFVQVLKYVKYGIIDLDYGGIFFLPTWVNEIRRYGVYIWGRPRSDAQTKPFQLGDNDLTKLEVYLKAVKSLEKELSDSSSELRRSIALAGDYYESHHTRAKREDQLIDLAIALEALFSPSHEGELKYRSPRMRLFF